MAPLAVDPAVLDGAGTALISAGEGLGSVITTLTTSLSGCSGMAGDDPAGAAFGRTYNSSASKLLEAMATTRNGLCRLGDGVRVSAHNYSAAEASSNVSGHGQPLSAPHQTGSISAGSAPSAVGEGVAAPAGWGWVSKYIGMIWPNGDSAKLRSAAAAWTGAGTKFEVGEILGAAGPMGSIGAQQIPEGPAIAAAFSATNRSAAGILQQCATIATQLTSLAGKIDTVHAAILDLLSRICNPLTGLKEVWEFLTDDEEDEIRKIAKDIRIIVNQFTAEVDALSQEIATALSEAAAIISAMARYAEKEWDHFLHDTDVGRALDHLGQMCNGVFTEAEGLVKSLWTFNPARAAVDPKGFWHSVSGAVDKLESLTGLEGEQSLKESWKELGKDTVHWDEWSTNPFQAAGESAFDLATVLIPGGALEKLPMVGRAAADVAERSEEFRPATLIPEPAPSHGNPAPRNGAPRSGLPEPGPPTKEPLPPYGLTESETPVSQKSAVGTEPRPAAAPETAAHAPSSTPAHLPPGAATGLPSASLPHGPVAAQPHSGAPSAYSPAPDHYGPVAHSAPSLTPQDLSAFANYTGPGHEYLNEALRTGTLDASQQAQVDVLSQALEKLPPHHGPVFRGTNLPADVLAQYQPGAVVSESAFFSTTTDLKVAQSPAFAGNVEFRIRSTTGRDISSFSILPSEQEVLFPNGVQFYVVGRKFDRDSGRTIIDMVER
ncbi:MAG TPA: ADP-ribosyltransferase domain-containing protein [Mycobacterium sp.]|nr:ADP-ribosyltransferase domain-containing protein [Mycobacterium sp.]